MCTETLIRKLLTRGDYLAIDKGRFSLIPASGKPIPNDWLEKNKPKIIAAILQHTEQTAFEYLGFSASKFGKHLAGGVVLQFNNLLGDGSAFTIYPAGVVRLKATKHGKAGSTLPKNHFRVSKRSKFYKFWLRTELLLPKRLSSFHDYMGKLKPLLFSAEYDSGEKLLKDSITLLSISHQQIQLAFKIHSVPDSSQTGTGQLPDKVRTKVPDTKTSRPHVPPSFPVDQTTGVDSHGIRLIGSAVTRDSPLPISNPIDPNKQTDDEWVADYSR